MGALFGFQGPPDEGVLGRMGQALAHRGTGAPCTTVSSAASLGLRSGGPSASGAIATDGDVALALAGWIFAPFSEKASSPAEHLLELYRREGLAFLGQVRGAWVLAIRDGETLHVARDGVGQRTLYYGRHNQRLYFASEPKALWSLPGFPRRIRPSAVARYLSFSFQPGAETMLEDVFELLPGECKSWEPSGEVRSFRHFDGLPEQEPELELDPEAAAHWADRFRSVLGSAIEERIPEQGEIAATLSGGIDSSVVVAELARQSPRPVRTFAVHFGEDYPNELDFARAVAERCGTQHEEVLIRPREFLPRLRRIVWHLDDPIGDPVTIPNFEVATHIGRITPWVFNGEGGDPCFGGPKNLTMMLHHWYGGIDRGPGFRERMYLASYRRAYEEVERLLTPEFRRGLEPEADLNGVLTPFFETARPRAFLDKLMRINLHLKAAHLILPKVERMQAAAGVVPLSPLFDERIVQLAFSMPPRMKVAAGIEKVVLKEAYRAELPRSVIDRPKSGMRVPVYYWFQGEMKRYARKVLSPRALRRAGIFDPDRVKQYLRYDTEERGGRYGLRIWMLLTFEIWRRIVIEGEEP